MKENNENLYIFENLNTIVTNLPSNVKINGEYQILEYGLNYGLATPSNERSVLAYTKDFGQQIERLDICSNEIYSKTRI